MARDGEVVLCPVWLMDERQKAVAAKFATFDADNHRPGYRMSADSDACAGARVAYDAMVTRTTNAWRTPGRTPAPAEPDADDPDELARQNLRAEHHPNTLIRSHLSLHDAERRRKRAYEEYVHKTPTRGVAPTPGVRLPSSLARSA